MGLSTFDHRSGWNLRTPAPKAETAAEASGRFHRRGAHCCIKQRRVRGNFLMFVGNARPGGSARRPAHRQSAGARDLEMRRDSRLHRTLTRRLPVG
jgi:hypothetical protein